MRVFASDSAELAKLERSYWLHASLAPDTRRGYWGTEYPAAASPAGNEVQNATRLLPRDYAANRPYLIYHREYSRDENEHVFVMWRRYCPTTAEIVPTLVLRAYDKLQTEAFSMEELQRLAEFFKRNVNPTNIAVYDVYQGRNQTVELTILAKEFPGTRRLARRVI